MSAKTNAAPETPGTETTTETESKPKFDPREKRSIYDIIQDLSKPIAPKYLKTRRQGGKEITYIPWYNATKILDYYANGWNYRIKEIMNISPNVTITVEISIPCLEGVVCREATGNEKETMDGYGDPFSNSESMALRRAAAKFGLARDLYDGDDGAGHQGGGGQRNAPQGAGNRQGGQNNTPPPARNNPPAQNRGNQTSEPRPAQSQGNGGGNGGKLASDAQLKFLIGLSNELEITEVDICDRATNGAALTFDALTVPQAVDSINWLKGIKESKGGAGK